MVMRSLEISFIQISSVILLLVDLVQSCEKGELTKVDVRPSILRPSFFWSYNDSGLCMIRDITHTLFSDILGEPITC